MTGTDEAKDADVTSLRSHLEQSNAKDDHAGIQIRSRVADIIEFPLKYKPHLKFAFNFTLLLMLVSFPAFSVEMRQWYNNIRGAWVGFTAAIALETSIGATYQIFLARSIGLTIGSAWGYMTYVAGDWGQNPYVMSVLMAIGSIPPFYKILVGTYPKAGVVYVVSANIVVLSTVRPTVPGTILENFAKRCLSMFVGGAAALAVQIIFFPVKAREELVKSIITAVQCTQRIEGLVAQGIDANEEIVDTPLDVDRKIGKLWKKAKSALNAADAFRECSLQEFRLKGPFNRYEEVYREIIFVLHQILDKFQNVSFLRRHYGSAVLEDLGPFVYVYRREFYGCLTTTLRAVEESLTNKSKLPQFLPSARVAHLRIINRVREVLAYESGLNSRAASRRSSAVGGDMGIGGHAHFSLDPNEKRPGPLERHSMTRQKYMSWSATSAGLEEIVEYVEELVDLTKLVIGVNEFKFGFLARPILEETQQESTEGTNDDDDDDDDDDRVSSMPEMMPRNLIKRTFSVAGERPRFEEPLSGLSSAHEMNTLRKIISRKSNQFHK